MPFDFLPNVPAGGARAAVVLSALAVLGAGALWVTGALRSDPVGPAVPAVSTMAARVQAAAGLAGGDAQDVARRVLDTCPLLARGFAEMRAPVAAPAAGGARELRFTTPTRFSLLPEGLPQVFAADKACVFRVDAERRTVSTVSADCDLVCTGSLPVPPVPGARVEYVHAY